MGKSTRVNSNLSGSNVVDELAKNWALEARERALLLQKHLISWFDDEQSGKQRAIQQSISGTDFTSEDIYYQLSAIKSRLEAGDLVHWVDQCTIESQPTSNENKQGNSTTQLTEQSNILCIHAGNLPLVGLQDTIAVLLAGHCYTGKISRKDPHLLPSILTWLVQHGWREQIQHWACDTADIPSNNLN